MSTATKNKQKLPFPALFIAHRETPRQALTIHACSVTMLFPSSQQAMIEITTPGSRHVVNKMVPFASLASTRGNAAAKTCQALAAIIEFLPAPDANVAAESALAGDNTGAGSSLPNPQLTGAERPV